jgi:hypothetical protein
VLAYAYVARCEVGRLQHRSADSNGIFNTVTPQQVPFNQETLTAYEWV